MDKRWWGVGPRWAAASVLASLASALLVGGAEATFTTAGECLQDDQSTATFCQGITEGVVLSAFSDKRVCLPVTVTLNQINAMSLKWTRDNPEHWDKPWAVVVLGVTLDRWPWPCK
jgi:hypothetical protein